MADARQYAKWCVELMEGNTDMIDDIYAELIDDNYLDEASQEWIYDDDDE